jgi:hypothetical protein
VVRALAKSSVKVTALLCAAACASMISGCGSGGDPGRPASPAASARSTCSPWAGLDDLAYITTWLRQLIGDEVIFGTGTEQVKNDGLAVLVYAESLDAVGQKLPARYARDLRDSVLSVAASPAKKTPEQLNTAANAAQSLATQISQLCF